MLQTLSQLGRIEDKQESNTNFRNVIGMNFKYNTNGVLEYDKSETHDFGDSAKFLYQRDFSGKPGLFLTGTIPQTDIKKLVGSEDNSRFIKNKVLWFPRGKLVNMPQKLDSLSDYRKKELSAIFQ